ncbi:MAG: hypothetical protein H0U60_13285 [Blastocatellia bacterium]|nr:hypothetical protein [Blastocatellia bacterium]
MDDLRLTGSTFGAPIVWVYGKQKLAGTIIWWAGLCETKHTHGGFFTPRPTTYEYSVDLAVGVCRGPVTAIKKIWAEDTLLYDVDSGITPAWIRIYLGTPTQNPDSLITTERSEHHGDEAPAYRNLCYVVFEDMPLKDYGNRVPNFAFVVQNGNSYQDMVLGDGAVAYYQGETVPGLLADTTNGDYDLTLTGGALSQVTGKYGQALAATTTSGQADRFSGPLPAFVSNHFSVELWFQYKGGTPSGNGNSAFRFFGHNDTVWEVELAPNLFLTQTIVILKMYDAVSNDIVTVHQWAVARDSLFHHLVIAVDTAAGVSSLYIDKVLQETQVPPLTAAAPRTDDTTISLLICDNYRLDEVAYYDKTLSAVQVAAHFDATGLTTQLKNVLADVFQQVGLTGDQYDLSQATDTVRGLLIGDRVEARQAIDAALRDFFIDLVEADGKLKAVKRGGSIVATIEADDLGAEMVESGLPEPKPVRQEKRGSELELPRRVEVLFTCEDTQYLAGNQDAKRYTKAHLQGELSFATNLVYTNAEARLLAERLLYHAWIERQTFEFSLPPKYLYLLPGDPVTLPITGGTARVRLTRVDLALPGPLTCTAVLDEPTILTQEVLGGTSEANTDPSQPCVNTALVAWNGNAARDADADSIGLYVGMNCAPTVATPADAAARFTGGPYLFYTPSGQYTVPGGGDMSIDLWFEFDTLTGGVTYTLAGTEGGSAALDGWYLRRDGGTGLLTFGYSTGAVYRELGTITPATGIWYHARFSYAFNGASPILSAVVQNTTTVLFSGTTSPVGAMNPSNQLFRLGWGAAGSTALIGRLDSVCVMGRLLTGGDIDMYNSGLGRTYADLAGNAILTGMTSFHQLDQASGTVTWTDAHTSGLHLLQAGGSVLSVPKRGLF